MARDRDDFWLVQRLSYRPVPKDREPSPLERLAGAFGGGRFNDDFTLDYMGSAEFEFGAIPEASKRLSKRKVAVVTYEFKGGTGKLYARGPGTVEYLPCSLDFLYRPEDGEPFEAWEAWVFGGMDTKERPYELPYRLTGEKPRWWRDGEDREWETALYWALNENVVWAFTEDGYMDKLLEGST